VKGDEEGDEGEKESNTSHVARRRVVWRETRRG
jgi:hypothetical protein